MTACPFIIPRADTRAATTRVADASIGRNRMNPRVFIQTMIALASVSLGLVAALAWNEAIKATLEKAGLGDDLVGLYSYAIVATLIAVVVLVVLGRLAAHVGGEAATLE